MRRDLLSSDIVSTTILVLFFLVCFIVAHEQVSARSFTSKGRESTRPYQIV